MFDICRSDKGFVSNGIKFFTYVQYKKIFLPLLGEAYPEFKGMTRKMMPTHAKVGEVCTQDNHAIHFESSIQQRLIEDYGHIYRFIPKVGVDKELFWELVDESIGDLYAFAQLFQSIKIWVWLTIFPWLVNRWSIWFHGGKEILWWGNMFPGRRFCTETMGNLMQKYGKKYNGIFSKSLKIADLNNLSPIMALGMLLIAEKNKEVVRA